MLSSYFHLIHISPYFVCLFVCACTCIEKKTTHTHTQIKRQLRKKLVSIVYQIKSKPTNRYIECLILSLFLFSDYWMEYSTHVFIQQTPITEQNFELKYDEWNSMESINHLVFFVDFKRYLIKLVRMVVCVQVSLHHLRILSYNKQ